MRIPPMHHIPIPSSPRSSRMIKPARYNIPFKGKEPLDTPKWGLTERVVDFLKHPQPLRRVSFGFFYTFDGPKTPLEEKILSFYRQKINLYLNLVFLITFPPLFFAYSAPFFAIKTIKFIQGCFTPHSHIDKLEAEISAKIKRDKEIEEAESRKKGEGQEKPE